MTPSIAATSGSKARCSSAGTREFAPARLAQRCDGQSSQPDVGETVMPGANGFGYFPRKESDPRRGTARKRHGCRVQLAEAVHFVRRHRAHFDTAIHGLHWGSPNPTATVSATAT